MATLMLASVGLYGVLSYGVASRTRELAVRAAVGVTRAQLFALVLRGGARVIVTGIAFGLVVALLATRLLASMLFGVGTLDGASFLMAMGVLLLVALAAIVVPARRATRSSPLIALQSE